MDRLIFCPFFLFDVFKVGLKLKNKKGAHQSPFSNKLNLLTKSVI